MLQTRTRSTSQLFTLGTAILLILLLGTQALEFQTKTIAQEMPFVSARNVLRVNLSFTGVLPGGSNITISGLTGSQTMDTASDFPVQEARGYLLLKATQWYQSAGSLRLTLDKNGLASGKSLAFTFRLINPNTDTTESAALTVLVSASYCTGTQAQCQQNVIPTTQMVTHDGELYGVPKGAQPLRATALSVKWDVVASTPLTGARNHFAVFFR